MSSYFRPNHRRRFTPVNPSPFRMALPASSYKQPIPRTHFVVYDQPQPNYTCHTQQSPMIPQYFDVDQSVDNFGPQQQARSLLTPVNFRPYNQTQSQVPIQSRRYYYEDASNVPFAGEPSYIITNPSQEANTVRIIHADGSTIEEIAELHHECDVEGSCAVSDPIEGHLQEERERREHSPSRRLPRLRVRTPFQSPRPEEQSQDEDLNEETAGVAGNVAEEGFGLSKDQILAELELLVTIMRQLLVEYRGLEAGEEESEEKDGLGEDEDAGESVEGRDKLIL